MTIAFSYHEHRSELCLQEFSSMYRAPQRQEEDRDSVPYPRYFLSCLCLIIQFLKISFQILFSFVFGKHFIIIILKI